MELYTFSGTGNSLHTARELAARFPDASIIPVLRTLQEDEIQTQSNVVGLVFPIHALTFPWPVRDFLEKADFSSAAYIMISAVNRPKLQSLHGAYRIRQNC